VITGSKDGLLSHFDINNLKLEKSIRYHDPANLKERTISALACYQPTTFKSIIIAGGGGINTGFCFIWDLSSDNYTPLFCAKEKRHRKAISGISVVTPGSSSSSSSVFSSSAPTSSIFSPSSVKTVPLNNTSSKKKEVPLTYLIIASQDRHVSIWNYDTRKILHILPKQHTDLLLTLTVFHETAISQDGSDHDLNGLHIITGSWDKSILFWNIPSNLKEPYYKLKGHRKSVTAMCFHTLKETSHSSSPVSSNSAHISDSTSSSLASIPCHILVTGSLDTTVIVWDFVTKSSVRTLKGHKDKISALSVYTNEDTPYFPWIISTSDDSTAIIWDLCTGSIIRQITYQEKISCSLAIDSKFGLLLLTGSCKGSLITNLTKTQKIKKFHTSPVTAIATFTPRINDPFDHPIALIGTIDSTCSVFNLTTHETIRVIKQHKSRINAMLIYIPPSDESSSYQKNPLVISSDGKAKICVWDLFTYDLIKECKYHDGAVLTLGLYEPHKVVGWKEDENIRREVHPSTDHSLSLSTPMIVSGGTDRALAIWDLLSNSTMPLQIIENAHDAFVRSIVVYHPSCRAKNEIPLILTGSYDKSVVVRSVQNPTHILYKLTGLHTNIVFFISLYDPYPHLGGDYKSSRLSDVNSDLINYPSLVTSSWDKTLGVWSIFDESLVGPEKKRLKHHLKDQHRDSITALTVYTPVSKDDNPLIISGSIDRMVIVWDLFKGVPLQKLIGHTDRVCCITTYTPPPHILSSTSSTVIRSPLVFSGGDDETTFVWEDSLHQTTFMPLRDDVNRCFDSDCMEEDWPLITELTKQYDSQLFLENPHLFFLAVKYNHPNFLLKFRKYLTLVLPLLKDMKYQGGTQSMNLLTYAVQRNDLISVRIILLSWTENLNRDINDLLTQKIFHACYFFPEHDLQILAIKYPLEFQHFIISLRLIRNHYSLLMGEIGYTDAYIAYQHENAILYDDAEDEDIENEETDVCVLPPFGTDDEAAVTEQKHSALTVHFGDLSLESNDLSDGKSIPPIMNRKRRQTSSVVPSDLFEKRRASTLVKLKRKDKLSNPDMNICSTCLHPSYRYEIEGTINRLARYDELWKGKMSIGTTFWETLHSFYYRMVTNEKLTPQPVTSLMVPLRNTAKLEESIKLYVQISRQLNSVAIFNSEIGTVSLRYFWDKHARYYHIVATCRYLCFLVLFMIASAFSYQYYDRNSSSPSKNEILCVSIMDAILLGFFCYYINEEYYQISHEKKKVTLGTIISHFFFDIWDFIDGAVIVTGVPGIVMRFYYQHNTVVGRCFLALCSILLWFKILYFMRPFSTSGPLGKKMLFFVSFHFDFSRLLPPIP
jgi:WD40 repeat protein